MEIWRRILRVFRAVKDVSDLVPSPYREVWIAAGLGVIALGAGSVLAFLESQPAHVVFLAGVWSLAGIAFFAWAVLGFYWRLQLVRLIRDIDRFIDSGTTIRSALKTERDFRIQAGNLKAVDQWREAMHTRVLGDPRIREFRDELTDADASRDWITVPLIGLEKARAHLETLL